MKKTILIIPIVGSVIVLSLVGGHYYMQHSKLISKDSSKTISADISTTSQIKSKEAEIVTTQTTSTTPSANTPTPITTKYKTISLKLYDRDDKYIGTLTSSYPEYVSAKKHISKCKKVEPGCIGSTYLLVFEYKGAKLEMGVFMNLDAITFNPKDTTCEKINDSIYYIEDSCLKKEAKVELNNKAGFASLQNGNDCPNGQECFVLFSNSFYAKPVENMITYKANMSKADKERAKEAFTYIFTHAKLEK